jgi:hypothetical protein
MVLKVGIRMENEKYIRAHPELDLVMRAIVKGVLKDRPSNITTYVYDFFARDISAVREDIKNSSK